jgi:long-chain acyl-CoA synthetase
VTTLSLASVLAEPAWRTPEKIALVEGPIRLTYGRLWQEELSCAGALAASGVLPGTRVALLAPNVADFARAYFGILAAGGVVVPVPTLLNATEAAYILSHSGAAMVLHHSSFEDVAVAAAAEAAVQQLPPKVPVKSIVSSLGDCRLSVSRYSSASGWELRQRCACLR